MGDPLRSARERHGETETWRSKQSGRREPRKGCPQLPGFRSCPVVLAGLVEAGFCSREARLGDFWQQDRGSSGVAGCPAVGAAWLPMPACQAQAAPAMAAATAAVMNKRFICAEERLYYTQTRPRSKASSFDTPQTRA
jgi:hypothetical protein